MSFRNGCYRRILCIEGSIYFFGYWLRVPRRPTESVRTKFGLMRSGKGGIILEEDSTEWNNSAIKRPRASTSISVSFLFWRVNERSKFTKVRSKKLNSFESNSSSHIFMTLKLSRSLWKQLMGECSCARVCSRAVFVNELQIFVVYILSVVFHFCWLPKTPFDLLCHPVIHLQREVASFIAQIIETVNVKCKCPAK